MVWGILTGEGDKIEIYPGIFDDAHGEDGSGVWISEQRRRQNPKRKPRESLLLRFQLYDAIWRIQGKPLGTSARQQEVTEVRSLLGGCNTLWLARYVSEIRKLRSLAFPNFGLISDAPRKNYAKPH